MNWDILETDIPNPIDGWVTIDEASKIVDYSLTAVAYWAEQGYINSYQVGQRTRIVFLEQVKAYAELRRRSRNLGKRGSDASDDGPAVVKSQ